MFEDWFEGITPLELINAIANTLITAVLIIAAWVVAALALGTAFRIFRYAAGL